MQRQKEKKNHKPLCWATVCLRWTETKWKTVLWSVKFFMEEFNIQNHGCAASWAKKDGNYLASYHHTVQSKHL